MYPQNKDEADKFAAGCIISLHSKATRDQNMKLLTDERAPVPARLATVTANIMTAMLDRVKSQAGRKPHITLLMAAVKLLIIEASRMAEIAGVQVTLADQKKAAEITGDMLESGNRSGQPQNKQPQQVAQNQPLPQQAPQGIVGGAMQQQPMQGQ